MAWNKMHEFQSMLIFGSKSIIHIVTCTYAELEPHGICETLTSHIRLVDDPPKAKLKVAVSEASAPISMYTEIKKLIHQVE